MTDDTTGGTSHGPGYAHVSWRLSDVLPKALSRGLLWSEAEGQLFLESVESQILDAAALAGHAVIDDNMRSWHRERIEQLANSSTEKPIMHDAAFVGRMLHIDHDRTLSVQLQEAVDTLLDADHMPPAERHWRRVRVNRLLQAIGLYGPGTTERLESSDE